MLDVAGGYIIFGREGDLEANVASRFRPAVDIVASSVPVGSVVVAVVRKFNSFFPDTACLLINLVAVGRLRARRVGVSTIILTRAHSAGGRGEGSRDAIIVKSGRTFDWPSHESARC